MKKKRYMILIAITCLVLVILMIGGLFGSAWLVASNADQIQFNGLIGKWLSASQGDHEQPPDDSPQTEQQTEQELVTDDQQIKDPYAPVFMIDAARIRDALMMGTLQENGAYVSLTVDNTWSDYSASLIPMGDSHAGVTCLVIMHRTDEHYEKGRITIAARTDSYDYRSIDFTYCEYDDYSSPIWRTSIIEIGDLFSGNPHNYIAYLDYAPFTDPTNGQSLDVAYIAGFSSTQDAQLYVEQQRNPIFMADAAYMANALESNPNHGIEDFKLWPAERENNGIYPLGNNGYVTLRTMTGVDSPYFTVCPYTGEQYSEGARYLAIKYRSWGANKDSAGIYVSSSAPEMGELYPLAYTDIDWQLIIVDLAEINAVNSSYDIEYLYLQLFGGSSEQETHVEIAWIGTFRSIYAAQRYDSDHPYAKG